MIVGVPREIKRDEYRVALLPVGVEELTRAGHHVLVEAGAGLGSGLADDLYVAHGAEIVATAAEVFARADMIIKVKEPLAGRMAAACGAGRSSSPTSISPPIAQLTEAVLASRLHGRGLRDAARRPRPAAAADAHERSRRPHEHPGRGQVPGTAADGPRHPAGRRAGRRAGPHHDPRRRRGRRQRRQGRRRLRRQHRPAGHQHGPAALPRRHHAGQRRPRCSATGTRSASNSRGPTW